MKHRKYYLGLLLMLNIDAIAYPIINDILVRKIPIIDNQEPLVDLRHQDFIMIGPSPEVSNNQNYYWVRQGVFEKLKETSRYLPKHVHLCLYEGYRSISLQTYLFQSFQTKIKQKYPHLNEAELFKKTAQLVAPIQNFDKTHNIPPHSTGAAIDVYLVNDAGRYLDMGIHPKDWQQDTSGAISLTDSPEISAEAKKNRLIMSAALEKAGFVNYPYEYWHWSYGDKYWAYTKKRPHALYDIIK
jgi:D-alanyl-D-alanine dipeptidase